MSKVIDRWIRDNEEREGHYAALVGFESCIRKSDRLIDAYENLDVYERIALFGLVFDLLEEESAP